MTTVFADTFYFLTLLDTPGNATLTGDKHFEQAGFTALLK
jgi:hypothetical protein